MSSIKKVALAGATGNLGPAILNALIESKLFEITALTRFESTHKFPDGVIVKSVDYTSESSVLEALQDQDALISTLGFMGLSTQRLLIDSSIKAGVQRFISSDFGSDMHNSKVRELPVFGEKVKAGDYLEERTKGTQLSYTRVFTNAFLDWGLYAGILLDVKGKKAHLHDGGDVLFSATTLASIGKGVVGVLNHPAETANRAVFIKDADVTQNQLISIIENIDPTGQWEKTVTSTEADEKDALAKLGRGEVTDQVMIAFLNRAMFGEGYGGRFQKVDNELLGVKLLNEQELEAAVRKAIGA